MTYRLMSAMVRNAEAPNTFWIPSDSERRAVKVGDYVKLLFSSDDNPDGEGPWVERMWVEVTTVKYPRYRGKLANEPFAPEAFGLSAGDPVGFHARHIIDTQAANSPD